MLLSTGAPSATTSGEVERLRKVMENLMKHFPVGEWINLVRQAVRTIRKEKICGFEFNSGAKTTGQLC
jgi:hypothetical protein